MMIAGELEHEVFVIRVTLKIIYGKEPIIGMPSIKPRIL